MRVEQAHLGVLLTMSGPMLAVGEPSSPLPLTAAGSVTADSVGRRRAARHAGVTAGNAFVRSGVSEIGHVGRSPRTAGGSASLSSTNTSRRARGSEIQDRSTSRCRFEHDDASERLR
jgi:hypothetical protein